MFKQLSRLFPPSGGNQPAEIRGPDHGYLSPHHASLYVCALRRRFGRGGVPGIGGDRGGEERVGERRREGECQVRGEREKDGGQDTELGGGSQEALEECGIACRLEDGDDTGDDGIPDTSQLGCVGCGRLVWVEREPEEKLFGVAGVEGCDGGCEVLVAALDIHIMGGEFCVDGACGVVVCVDDEAVEGVAELGLGRGGRVAGEEGGPRDGGGGVGGGGQVDEGECSGGVLGGLVFEEGGGRGRGRGGDGGNTRGEVCGEGEGEGGYAAGGVRGGGGAPQQAEDVERVAHFGGGMKCGNNDSREKDGGGFFSPRHSSLVTRHSSLLPPPPTQHGDVDGCSQAGQTPDRESRPVHAAADNRSAPPKRYVPLSMPCTNPPDRPRHLHQGHLGKARSRYPRDTEPQRLQALL